MHFANSGDSILTTLWASAPVFIFIFRLFPKLCRHYPQKSQSVAQQLRALKMRQRYNHRLLKEIPTFKLLFAVCTLQPRLQKTMRSTQWLTSKDACYFVKYCTDISIKSSHHWIQLMFLRNPCGNIMFAFFGLFRTSMEKNPFPATFIKEYVCILIASYLIKKTLFLTLHSFPVSY